jgi:hypothetical protein
MILEHETFIKFGEFFSKIKLAGNVVCKCDYCGAIFDRTKFSINRGRKIVKIDVCRSKECIVRKRKESCKVAIGFENPMHSEVFKDKQKQTVEERWGVDNVFKSKQIKEGIRKKHLENLGVDHPSKSEKIKENKKKTWIANLGVDNPQKSIVVKEKTEKTCQETYGKKCVFQVSLIKEKIKTTNIKNFGVENPSQSIEIQKKREQTFLSKLGVCNPFSSEEIWKKIKDKWREKYGQPFPPQKHKAQELLRDWLNSFGFNFQSTWDILINRELDLYDDNLKFAIEFCGNYWHTELSKTPRGKKYHYDKYKRCLDKGIRLITIFSDEWFLREMQCKNFLKASLGVCERRIYARQCKVVELFRKDFNEFVDQNHIQSSNNLGLVFFGLNFEEKLVGAMSLGRHMRGVNQICLDRLCFLDGVNVIGGSKRLFSKCREWAVTKGHNKIVTFSDNRWSQGLIYSHLGFSVGKEYRPDYSYVLMKAPLSRFSKQSQSKKSTKCPQGLTEAAWAIERGLAKIWDCGKKRWEINF